MADDSELTDEERTAVNHAWPQLWVIEDKAHGGKLHYTMPDVRGMRRPALSEFRRMFSPHSATVT